MTHAGGGTVLFLELKPEAKESLSLSTPSFSNPSFYIYVSRYFLFCFLLFYTCTSRFSTGRTENSFSYLLCPINTYQATRLDLCIAYPI